MEVFLYAGLAILLFLFLGDKRQLRHQLPIVITATFVRFLEQFFVIDLLKLWEINGPHWMQLWLPIIADVTIWPIAAYFYVQYLPNSKRFWYTLGWAVALSLYVYSLNLFGVIRYREDWFRYFTILLILGFFAIVHVVWAWLLGPWSKPRTFVNSQ